MTLDSTARKIVGSPGLLVAAIVTAVAIFVAERDLAQVI
jgi:hypothetical protein